MFTLTRAIEEVYGAGTGAVRRGEMVRGEHADRYKLLVLQIQLGDGFLVVG